MTERIAFDPHKMKDIAAAMHGLQAVVRKSTLELSLIELVRTRVSQINGCGFCIDMHTQEARAAGETEQRLYLLSAWREANCYTERERAALAWAEAVTKLEHQDVAHPVYAQARSQFGEAELLALTLAIVEINGWNRFAIPLRYVAGDYRPGSLAKAHTN
ncbi:MAG TPA: carboxymuconolactone decarboxylase family protein [Povalibacter sp.]|uniref:carboxymuconolactone decarboxylase family protein n=1 Tax=Povalibacter sp. TaxID=1962978 RepID=UPI002C87C1F4|nr:carboxymuconolactone decarboxylase family protein [Povalibacter sp.]HMN46292.1 carboxymuconolactone decarboxylase family protein [Povalibacter sp.]